MELSRSVKGTDHVCIIGTAQMSASPWREDHPLGEETPAARGHGRLRAAGLGKTRSPHQEIAWMLPTQRKSQEGIYKLTIG